MSQTEARLVVFLLAIVAVAFVWPCAAAMGRYGPRSPRAMPAGLGYILFGVVEPLSEIWLYGRMTGVLPIRDNMLYITLILQGLAALAILFYNVYRFDRQRRDKGG